MALNVLVNLPFVDLRITASKMDLPFILDPWNHLLPITLSRRMQDYPPFIHEFHFCTFQCKAKL